MWSPLVSVIIPAYDQAQFVGEAIQSVLDQTYAKVEVIVVVDASPDCTSEIVQQFGDPRVRLIVHQANRGLPATRNTGIRASSGGIIALLDADDLFHPEKLRVHLDFLRRHPDVGVTYNARFEMDHSANTVRELWRPPLSMGLTDLVLGFPFSPSDMVLRREWPFRIGLFDLSKGTAEDTDLPCRLALEGCKFASVDRALNYRRYHSCRPRKDLPRRLDDVARALNTVFGDPRCPAEVSALRSIAIKHHLMVLVSLAFIQEETDLGQEYLRELVRVDPSILKGMPCDLVEFLLQECVADESVNHEGLLQRIFSQMPPEMSSLSDQYDWAVARGYLVRGTRSIIWDRQEAGRAHFAQAAELRAEIGQPFLQSLTHQLLAYENEFGKEAALAVIGKLTPLLAEVDGRRRARLLKASYSVNHAFHSFRTGNYGRVFRQVAEAVTYNPGYLMNRGVLSILMRSIIRSRFRLDFRSAVPCRSGDKGLTHVTDVGQESETVGP